MPVDAWPPRVARCLHAIGVQTLSVGFEVEEGGKSRSPVWDWLWDWELVFVF